ncbi:MAG TPA: aminotransferase class V-fold PLP-dependent enzyme [Nannocystis exedens]|nr:aminotransferase class V-fold PLP-dependent enzyme [Nannocystis exedens]
MRAIGAVRLLSSSPTMRRQVPDLPPPRFGDRSLFPDLTARAYLNHSAISPPSSIIRRTLLDCANTYARIGVDAFMVFSEQRERMRLAISTLIGASSPAEIALTSGTSAGVMSIALCFPWKEGDKLVLFDGEFPANVTPWQRAAKLYNLRPQMLSVSDFLPAHATGLERLENTLKAGDVRLVAVSAVQFQNGLRMPLRAIGELCHRYGAELFVDAIQGCGSTPIHVDSENIDYLACGGHKHLMAVEGAGFLYIHQRRVAALRPHVAGWLSLENPIDFLLLGAGHMSYDRPVRKRADFIEAGGYNALGHAALGAGIDVILGLGVAAIHEHSNRYNDLLEAGLLSRGFTSLRSPEIAGRSAILSVLAPPGKNPVALHQQLGERGIAISLPDGKLRFAPHWPNDPAEINLVLQAVDFVLPSC